VKGVFKKQLNLKGKVKRMTTKIERIKKRSGEIVDFEPEKIKKAISNAFTATRGNFNDKLSADITQDIIDDMEKYFPADIPTVENVQNIVEKVLMEKDFFDVAKSYIIYRYEHNQQRQEEKKQVLKKIEKHALSVVKSDGRIEEFLPEKLKRTIQFVAKGYENDISIDAIVEQTQAELYDNIPTHEIARALVLATRSLIEQDPAYSKVASRLLLRNIYKEAAGEENMDFTKTAESYKEAFKRNIKRGVELGRLDSKILLYDLDEMADEMKFDRDDHFNYLGIQTLYDRYFIRDDETKDIIETPQGFWMRVAMGLAIEEKNRKEWALKFYEMLSNLRFVSSTPTLFHAGTSHPQLSSCYITTVMDSLEHIFKSVSDNAMLSKWSGGIGNDWTNVRGTGAFIKGTGVESQGVVPFLKIANDTTVAINRSGRRRGASCVYLETWHYDIEDFLELRKNTGDDRRRTHDINTANWVPDLFMKRVQQDGDWTLFSPDEVEDLHHIYGSKFEERYTFYESEAEKGNIRLSKKIKARDLWRKMITSLFETGHPWITFKDPCNVRSPQDHAGVVHSSNLCTEITLNTSAEETAVCNLGSVNLSRHIKNGKLDTEKVKETVGVAMRMLDNVIDINFYPTKEAKFSNRKHRPVGLGVMGFQDALYLTGIDFDSEDAVTFADESMELVSYHAILTSSKLAGERGAYESFPGSKWDRGLLPLDTLDLLEKERGMKIDVDRKSRLDWTPVRESIKKHGMRNSNCLAVAPTATISNISGCFPTIEPIYKNIYVKSNASGDFVIVNHYLVEDLKKLNLWDFEMLGKLKYHDGNIEGISEIPDELKKKYKEVFQIDPRHLMKVAAYRGKWIDQSQSLNVFFSGTSGREISEVYQYGWQLGLKTTYYLRSLAVSQVEKSTIVSQETVGRGKEEVQKKEAPEPVQQKPKVVSGTAVSMNPSSSPVMNTKEEKATVPKVDDAKLCKVDDPDCEACQ
jgi:ribonucleoside-diphosphate reductase alpha chain